MFYKKNKVINKNIDNPNMTYPARYVFWSYSCFGGAVGGGLVGVGVGFDIYDVIPLLAIVMPIACATMGVFIGFIPAMMTGYILMKLEAQYGSWYVPVVGALVSGILTPLGMTFVMLYNEYFDIELIYVWTAFNTVVGALTALIIGKRVLPKH